MKKQKQFSNTSRGDKVKALDTEPFVKPELPKEPFTGLTPTPAPEIKGEIEDRICVSCGFDPCKCGVGGDIGRGFRITASGTGHGICCTTFKQKEK